MPNPEQIRYFWLKWIDRQFAKVDPSHVKMRAEVSRIGENYATAEDLATGASARDRANKSTPIGNRSEGPSANTTIEGRGNEAIQIKPQLKAPGWLR